MPISVSLGQALFPQVAGREVTDELFTPELFVNLAPKEPLLAGRRFATTDIASIPHG